MTQNFADQAFIKSLGSVAVLYGGTSAEREISLRSGEAVITALRGAGVSVVPVDIGENPLQQLPQLKVDRVFIALHGTGGEDGKIQALLEWLQLPYTGSGIAASALCMDKLRTKQLWRGVGLSTPDYRVLSNKSDWRDVMQQLGGVAMVKPCHEGSSIGMAKVSSADELAKAYANASQYDSVVLAERYIQGAEYTVAILDGVALPPIKLETHHQFYDFSAKYQANDTRYICPCGLPAESETRLKNLALAAFQTVGAEGWGRVDVMADAQGEFYLLELNTVPGMTDHSLVPMAAKAAGYSFTDLVLAILRQTLD
ncbi:MAG: D-alanine--D-alanine ligase [Cellvibrionaceae bacterium]|nr:D-alanine--D-alanine ligase [Cellvibrionaceae bacterium]